MIKWFKCLLNLILPQRCLLCGRVIQSENSLCADCFKEINFIVAPYCQHCGKPLDLGRDDIQELMCISCLNKKDIFRLCRSAIIYDDKSKKLILDFKFADHLENKLLLSKWLYYAGRDIFDTEVDLIIPVPLHYTRLIKRKYNQSAVLAAELSKLTNISADYKSLKKIRYTIPQVQCDGKRRKINVRNAFVVTNPDRIKGKRIVLVDDVYTTGATMRECAKVLLKSGAKSVDVLTVARVCK